MIPHPKNYHEQGVRVREANSGNSGGEMEGSREDSTLQVSPSSLASNRGQRPQSSHMSSLLQ